MRGSTAGPNGSSSATARSARCARTTTATRRTRAATCSGSIMRDVVTPPFEEERELLRETIRRFVATELRPRAMEWEDAQWMPNDVFGRCGELGLLGLKYEERYGGQGGGYLHDAVLAEELARCGSGGVGAAIGGHVNIATPPIWKFGSDEQKQRWLVPAIKGEKIGALGITEPD